MLNWDKIHQVNWKLTRPDHRAIGQGEVMRIVYSNRDDSDEVYIPFSQMLRESERAYLAAPYFTLADPLLEAANSGKEIKLLVELNAITSPKELRKLVGVSNIEIKYFIDRFHAKIYVFDNFALLGSANLTSKGLKENREAVIKLCREEDSDATQEIYKLFHELWEAGAEFDEKRLVEFEREHKELSRLREESRKARSKLASVFGPIAPVPIPPIIDGITENELKKACEEVFGTSRSMTSGKDKLKKPPMQCVEELNLYFATIQHSIDAYRVFFLPESWIDPVFKDGRTWPECKWKGFLGQPLMADFFFYVDKDKVRLFGQLITTPGDDRRKIAERINKAAEQIARKDPELINIIKFGPKSHPDSRRSGFLQKGTYQLNGKYDAKSLAKVMRQAISDFKPFIDEIGKWL